MTWHTEFNSALPTSTLIHQDAHDVTARCYFRLLDGKPITASIQRRLPTAVVTWRNVASNTHDSYLPPYFLNLPATELSNHPQSRLPISITSELTPTFFQRGGVSYRLVWIITTKEWSLHQPTETFKTQTYVDAYNGRLYYAVVTTISPMSQITSVLRHLLQENIVLSPV